jgi:hypothetical protein
MANFNDYRDWNGSWVGSYDGRPGTMAVNASLEPDSSHSRISVNFDQGDGSWWSGVGTTQDARSHQVEGQRLDPTGPSPGGETLDWPRMLIHTWDTNFVSGISRWDGKDYGFWFEREGTGGPTYFEGPRFTSWYNLDGGGDRPHNTGIGWASSTPNEAVAFDGREASISILVSPAGPHPENDCHVDFIFTDSEDHSWRGWKIVRPWEHWIDDLELTPTSQGDRTPGTDTLRWPLFYLHTWCTAHASGWSKWSDQLYGILLKNGSPIIGR